MSTKSFIPANPSLVPSTKSSTYEWEYVLPIEVVLNSLYECIQVADVDFTGLFKFVRDRLGCTKATTLRQALIAVPIGVDTTYDATDLFTLWTHVQHECLNIDDASLYEWY